MKINMKLVVGFSVIALLIWITVFLALNTYTNIHQEVELLNEDVIPIVIAMTDMERTAEQVKEWLLVYVMRGNVVRQDRPVREWLREGMESLEEMAKEYKEQVVAVVPEEAKIAQELENKVRQLNSAAVEVINLKDQGAAVDELLEKSQESFGPVFFSLTKQAQEHKAKHLRELAEAPEVIHQAHTSGVRLLFFGGALITTLAGVVAFLTARSIVKPLQALHKGTEIIAEGKFDHKVGTRAKNEIGQLSRAFDRMTGKLAKTTTSVTNLNQEIAIRQQVEEALKKRTYDLGERIKELNCLYGISKLVGKPGISLEEIIKGTVDLIPSSWRYPEITSARIITEGQVFATENYRETEWKQTSRILIDGESVGTVEVCYSEERPESDEGPFLREERNLINAITKQLARSIKGNRARKKLEQTMSSLERFNRLAVGREHQMIELKREVNDLLHSLGHPEKYKIPGSKKTGNQEGE